MHTARIPWRALLRAGGLALGVGLPVAALAYLVRSGVGPIDGWDHSAIVRATDFTRAHEGLHQSLLVWQELSQPRWVYLAGALVCLWVWRRQHALGRAVWGLATIAASWLVANLAKEAVRRARPVIDDALTHAGGTSFPSGHAVASAATGTTIALLLWPALDKRGRVVVVTIAVLFALTTAADRILIGAHYPSDIVGGILLGVTIPAASYLGYRGLRATPEHTPTRRSE